MEDIKGQTAGPDWYYDRMQALEFEFGDELTEEEIADIAFDSEKFYDIKATVSFDPGRITFFKRSLNILKNFMDLLEDTPISYFAKCEHCGKCIVLTRTDKKFCPGCAAKKYQKDKWEKDTEGMKQREKERYQTRRRRSVH